jgi:hypothetical protein
MRIAASAIAATLLLYGCGEGGQAGHLDEAVALNLVEPTTPGGAPSPTTATSLTAPQVAYVYHYGLELPADRAPGLLSRHEQACVAAGAAVCQVIGSESSRIGDDAASARLEIRATPSWIARFRAGLAGDAKAAGGKIVNASTESEDLTRTLIDTEARLRAQTTLRDRLQQLLATRTGDLEQLLKVESELARVQGEIDSVQSTLAVLRTRVAMSRLDIRYDNRAALAGESVFAPLSTALTGAFGVFIQSLAVLVTLLAVSLPFALIAGLLLWLGMKRRRRLQMRKDASPTAEAPPEN